MKKPIIFSVTENGENAPIFSQGDYDVFVGTLEEDRLPQYVVINRKSGVVEFTNEVTLGYRSWLDSIEEAQEQHERQQQARKGDPGQVPLNFSFKN